jgi:hypothetical protein
MRPSTVIKISFNRLNDLADAFKNFFDVFFLLFVTKVAFTFANTAGEIAYDGDSA